MNRCTAADAGKAPMPTIATVITVDSRVRAAACVQASIAPSRWVSLAIQSHVTTNEGTSYEMLADGRNPHKGVTPHPTVRSHSRDPGRSGSGQPVQTTAGHPTRARNRGVGCFRTRDCGPGGRCPSEGPVFAVVKFDGSRRGQRSQ
jgi:hypothetical protein